MDFFLYLQFVWLVTFYAHLFVNRPSTIVCVFFVIPKYSIFIWNSNKKKEKRNIINEKERENTERTDKIKKNHHTGNDRFIYEIIIINCMSSITDKSHNSYIYIDIMGNPSLRHCVSSVAFVLDQMKCGRQISARSLWFPVSIKIYKWDDCPFVKHSSV